MVVTSRVVVMVIGLPFAVELSELSISAKNIATTRSVRPDPPVAARVVGHLLIGEARDEGREEVEVGLVGDAGRGEPGATDLVELDGDRVRRVDGSNPGIVPLEQRR